MCQKIINLNKPIVLVGIMGAGKSAVGQRLAKSISYPFFDIDQEVEKIACCSISDIFFYAGEEYFRKVELQVINSLLSKRAPMVIATGGGAFVSAQVREAVKKNAISIWLKAELEVLVERVSNKPGTRPLIDGKDTRKILDELIKKRYPIYSEADIMIISDSKSLSQTVTAILSSIEQYENA